MHLLFWLVYLQAAHSNNRERIIQKAQQDYQPQLAEGNSYLQAWLRTWDPGPGTTDHQIQVVVGSGRRGTLEPRTARLRVPRADRSAVTVFYRKK